MYSSARSLLFAGLLVVAACAPQAGDTGSIAASATARSHEASVCSGAFVAHDLNHVTSGSQDTTTLFDGTGSGVAVDDLDKDGDPDIVLANLSGESSVFSNDGGLEFTRSDLVTGRFRQIAPIDVNDDRVLDLVLTTGVGRPVVLLNDGAGTFTSQQESVLDDVAYSIGWGDVDGDGDIDLATGSYNAELTAQRDFSSVLGDKSGVTMYERTDAGFVQSQMADIAQALVIRFHDVDGDGAVDLQAGNDLATPDNVWLRQDGAWIAAEPFPRTTFSTMSLDSADIDNDGDFDLYATDMHPMDDELETLAAWEPVMEDMAAMPMVDEVQAMENVLLDPDDGAFTSRAVDLGIPYTGWSWSGVFGDLDHDGFVDLYVVNGMESPAMFPNLPNGALIEENQAFRNNGGSSFEPAPDWGLADEAGGRGMAMADLDADGDLDIVINNLNAPARIFENQVCGGSAVTIDLHWSGVGNAAALGSRVEIRTDEGETISRMVDANRGYLSSGPATIHAGVGAADSVDLTIVWPDGETSSVSDIAVNTHTTVTR